MNLASRRRSSLSGEVGNKFQYIRGNQLMMGNESQTVTLVRALKNIKESQLSQEYKGRREFFKIRILCSVLLHKPK